MQDIFLDTHFPLQYCWQYALTLQIMVTYGFSRFTQGIAVFVSSPRSKYFWHRFVNIGASLHIFTQGKKHGIRMHRKGAVSMITVYPKKYAHGFCFAVLCCGYTLTDFPISIRLTSLALWQSNDCPSASKATLMNMDKYFMWIHYERLHNHNKAKHNKTVCIFLGIYCKFNNTGEVGARRRGYIPIFYVDMIIYPYAYADAGLINLCWYSDWLSSSKIKWY